MRIIFPNSLGLAPESRVDFWNYESNGAGWYLYGQGAVTRDGRQVMPDPGVELQSMHCLSFMTSASEAVAAGMTPGNGARDGDPVDLSTGLFLYERTDMVLPDVIPIVLSRTYRQMDTRSRSFGIGMAHPYEMFIAGDSNTYGDLILPDGGRIRYNRDTTRTDGVWGEHTSTPTVFYKSTLTYNTTREPAGWDIKFRDGSIYRFDVIVGRFGFPGSATLSGIEDRYGNKLTITGNKIISPNGRWIEFTRNAGGQIAQAKDNTGRIVTYTYDANYRLWKVTDPNEGVTEYSYDAAGRMLSIKDAREIVYLTNEYDSNGRVFKQTQADQSVYQFAYTLDASGKIIQTDVTDPRLNVRRTTFNASGYTLTDTFALGKPEQQVFTYERQSGTNLVVGITDPLLRQTTLSYGAGGNVTAITRLAGTADAVTTTITYEPRFNQVASVTAPLNHTTTYAYNGRGKLSSVTDALGHKTVFGYDPAAQLTSVRDALGNTTRFNYEAGTVVEVIDPLGLKSKNELDGAGRVTRKISPLGVATSSQYNDFNQPTQGTDPSQGLTGFVYDPNGNLLSVTDARQGVTSYTYDSMNRVKKQRDPLLHDESYEYNEVGDLRQVTDRKGQITSYTYDALNRLKQVTFADASTVTCTYDAGNRTTQVVDSQSGTLTYGYDNFDRLTSETSAQGTVSYTYDAAGRRSTMTVAGQPTVNYTYDDGNRLTQITQGSATVIIGYDDLGRRTSLTMPNGMTTVYGYDAASHLTSLTYKRNTVVLGNLTYEYDGAGRRTKTGGSYARAVAPQSLSSATYNAANQQTDFNGQSLTYDLNGNLTNDGANTYTWNARNQLVSISGSVNATFQYDAAGRRSSKNVNSTATNYLYDGDNIVQELSGTTPTVNLLNGGLDEFFSRSDAAGAWSPITDGLGSTLALGDSSGTIQSEYTYGAFGGTARNGATNTNASQYTGRENDQTGLYYYRNRYYLPRQQRFISEDPIGFGGGDVNLYAYVGNSAINFGDPLGLKIEVIIWKSSFHHFPKSLFGHVSYEIDGVSYSWEGDGWRKPAGESIQTYLADNQQWRSGTGFELDFGSEEANERFKDAIKGGYNDPRLIPIIGSDQAGYSILGNNCGHAFARACNKNGRLPENDCVTPFCHNVYILTALTPYIKGIHPYPQLGGRSYSPPPTPSPRCWGGGARGC
jgi:RHS repeat-associated protein